MKLILASTSRDRKKCFDDAHIPVEIIPSQFDEESITETDPYQLVKILAQNKGTVVLDFWKKNRLAHDGHAIIIGADTTVIFHKKIIGKARDKQHAFEILSELSGKTHEIITGVCVMTTDSPKITTFVDSTKLHFQKLTPEQIWDYINVTNEWEGRAAAYSLLDRAGLFIDKIEGSHSNVIGLPMATLRTVLLDYGINLLKPLF